MNSKYKARKRQQFVDKKFLNELQHELKTQETDWQAAPRFWVLMDYKEVLAPDGYGEKTRIYDGEDSLTEEAFKRIVKDHYEEDMLKAGFDQIDYDSDIEDLVDSVNKYVNADEYEVFEVVTESFIVPNTMFLTKAEAKRHIELNYYHYTSRVHTYAMTAWRAPKVAKLLRILQETQW